jgi:N-hydroxyarylamine O-acetyltransferase
MDFESAPVGLDAFAAQHDHLSTDPTSPFVRLASAFRRTPKSVVVLRSVGLSETSADRVDNTLLDNPTDYFTALADVFRLPLPQYTQSDRDNLWRRVWSQYEEFLARTTSL